MIDWKIKQLELSHNRVLISDWSTKLLRSWTGIELLLRRCTGSLLNCTSIYYILILYYINGFPLFFIHFSFLNKNCSPQYFRLIFNSSISSTIFYNVKKEIGLILDLIFILFFWRITVWGRLKFCSLDWKNRRREKNIGKWRRRKFKKCINNYIHEF